jgi:hypothetical protein
VGNVFCAVRLGYNCILGGPRLGYSCILGGRRLG